MGLEEIIIANNEEDEALNIVKNYERLIKLVRKQIISDVKNKNFEQLETLLSGMLWYDPEAESLMIAFLQPKDRKEFKTK